MSLFLWSRTPTSLGVITSSSFAAHFVFSNRVFAAQWLWERTGETKEVLPILLEEWKSNDDFACQAVPQVLANPVEPLWPRTMCQSTTENRAGRTAANSIKSSTNLSLAVWATVPTRRNRVFTKPRPA
jgi:hypothetical protein